MTLLYSFLIDGTEVLNYVLEGTKINLTRDNNENNSAEIHLSENVSEVLTITAGMEVVISRGLITSTDNYKFKGEVKQIEYQENTLIIKCFDKLDQLRFKLFTASYDKNIDSEAGELSAIFADIVTNGGFTPSVVNSGTSTTDITIDKFISKNNTRLNRMKQIASILNWFFYYDYDEDLIKLEPKGYTTFNETLVVGSNIVNIPKWEQDLQTMRNKITVEGAFALDNRLVTATGGSSATQFNFDYTPVSTDCTVGGTAMIRGVEGVSSDYDYTVDEYQKTFTFTTASTPLTGQTIVMNYTTKIPIPVVGTDPDSTEKYGLTQEDIYNFDDITTVDDAETRVKQIIDLLKDGSISTDLYTDEYNVKVGQKVLVEDSNNPTKNGDYIVYNIIINFPLPYDTLKIGNPKFSVSTLFETIQNRIKTLENKDSELAELLRHLIDAFHTIRLRRKSLNIETTEVNDSMIWGHPKLGIWGTAKWGDRSSSAVESYTATYF